MTYANLGLIVLLIAVFGYLSNALNWRYLNYGAVRLLYYIGALVHEASHAVLCVLTGAKIEEFSIFSEQPRVVHQKSKIPILGELLISAAPIAGGLLFLFLINRYLLGDYFVLSMPALSGGQDWRGALDAIFVGALTLVAQIDLAQWQSWVMILVFFNVGAMLGPSLQDLKNVWPALILLFFIPFPWAVGMGSVALRLILVNIILQIIVIAIVKTLGLLKKIKK